MKNLTSFTKQALLIAFCTMFFSCTNYQNNTDRLPAPKVKAGIAKISGTINNLKLPEGEKKVTFEIILNPVAEEESKYVTNLDENNQFSLEVPLKCSHAIVAFSIVTDTKIYAIGIIGIEEDKSCK